MTRLPRLVGLLVVLGATVVGLLVLSDATKFRGEASATGATTVEFTVETRNYHHDAEDAAEALWHACVSAVSWEDQTPPVAAPAGDGTYVASVRPALGEDSRRRFRGCLEDATVDRLRGHVVRMVSDEAGG